MEIERAADAGPVGRIRVLSANLWNGKADPEAFAELVQREDVDLACVQELAPEQAEALASVLPHGVLEPDRHFRGMGIASRRPVESACLPLRYRPLRAARLDPKDWPGLAGPLALWNVHVRAPHSFPQHRSWAMRREQLRGLVGHLDDGRGPQRLVLVGDFNATPVWPVYRRVARRVDDAALSCARRRGGRPERTWGPLWKRAPRLRLLRIDHAFTRGVEASRVRTLDVPGSDHDALCVDLELG
jgi:endonuclease/exonuclease/phosphatase (EEP) superfamily protein YafD